jgi:hypothetical protein
MIDAHRYCYCKDHDKHDEVEGSGVPPLRVPHLIALSFRTWGVQGRGAKEERMGRSEAQIWMVRVRKRVRRE